jgi:hypothetical protein
MSQRRCVCENSQYKGGWFVRISDSCFSLSSTSSSSSPKSQHVYETLPHPIGGYSGHCLVFCWSSARVFLVQTNARLSWLALTQCLAAVERIRVRKTYRTHTTRSSLPCLVRRIRQRDLRSGRWSMVEYVVPCPQSGVDRLQRCGLSFRQQMPMQRRQIPSLCCSSYQCTGRAARRFLCQRDWRVAGR